MLGRRAFLKGLVGAGAALVVAPSLADAEARARKAGLLPPSRLYPSAYVAPRVDFTNADVWIPELWAADLNNAMKLDLIIQQIMDDAWVTPGGDTIHLPSIGTLSVQTDYSTGWRYVENLEARPGGVIVNDSHYLLPDGRKVPTWGPLTASVSKPDD